LPTIIINH